jgi:hypothetical protein
MFNNRQHQTTHHLLSLEDGGWVRYSKNYAAICISDLKDPTKSTLYSVPEYDAIAIQRGRRFLFAHPGNVVKIRAVDPQKNKLCTLATLETQHKSPINCLANVSENEFVSGHEDGTLLFWDIKTGKSKPKTIETDLSSVDFLVHLKQRKLLVACDVEGNLFFYELATRTTFDHTIKAKTTLNLHSMTVSSIEQSIVLAGTSQLVVVNISTSNVITERTMSIPKTITGKLQTCALRSDGYLMTGHNDGTILTIDPKNFAVVDTCSTGKLPIFSLQLLRTGQLVFTNRNGTHFSLAEAHQSKEYTEEEQRITNHTFKLFPTCLPEALVHLTLKYALPLPRLEETNSSSSVSEPNSPRSPIASRL